MITFNKLYIYMYQFTKKLNNQKRNLNDIGINDFTDGEITLG
jgi:hypothetical protein